MNRHPLASLLLLPLPLVLLAVPTVAAAAEKPPAITLQEALDRLDSQSLTLAQARGRAQEARAIVRESMAAFLPAATATGNYTRNSASAKMSVGAIFDGIESGISQLTHQPVHLDRSGVPGDIVIQPLESFSGTAGVRVPLFAGNAYWDWEAAKESAKASELSVDAARLQLRSVLVQAAYWAVATEEIADASERAVSIATEHEQSAKRAVEVGNSAPLTHLQAETEVVRREKDLAQAIADRERAWLALGVLMGKPEPVRVAVPALPAGPPAAFDDAAATKEALSKRPELRVDETLIHAAELGVDSAWWRLAPQLSAGFLVLGSTAAFPTGDKGAWKATVDLTWTLYDGGFRYGKKAQSEAQIAQGRAALQAQKVEVAQQVKDAARDVAVAGEQLRLAERNRALALEVQASAKRSFEAGIASSLDVLDANDKLYLAEVGMASARARLGMAQAALDRATGSLL